MKVKVIANELVDTDIDMVSLVRHGANRCPFKVIKSDEGEAPSLKERITDMLSLTPPMPQIAAFFIRKGDEGRILPVLAAHGFEAAPEDADGLLIVKAEGGLAVQSVFQVTEALAVGLDQPARFMADEKLVKAHSEAIGLDGFFPCVGLSLDALASGVWKQLNTDEGGPQIDRLEKADTMLASFRKYIAQLGKSLPEQVLKIEVALQNLTTDTGMDMSKERALEETVAGDLDGLEKTAEVTATETVEDATVAKAAKPEEVAAVVAAVAEAASADDDEDEDEDDKEGEAVTVDKSEEIALALTEIAKAMSSLREDLSSQRAQVAKLEEQIAETREVTERVKTTTVVNKSDDSDLALLSLGGTVNARRGRAGQVSKSGHMGDSVWDGLFNDLESFRSR